MSTRAKCEPVRLLECCDTRCPLSLSRRLAWCYAAMVIQVAGFFVSAPKLLNKYAFLVYLHAVRTMEESYILIHPGSNRS